MARLARYLENHGYYHVISRAINQTHIFSDVADFGHFRQLELDAKIQFPIRLFHYVFMHTHFHFVLQVIEKEDLSLHLSYIKWHYTQWMRKKYGWRGPLWRERFKSLAIQDERYLTACGHYIAWNPVRAGICRHPADYPHGSYAQHHRGLADPLVDDYTAPRIPRALSHLDYRSAEAMIMFSRSPVIGDVLFQLQYRQAPMPVP